MENLFTKYVVISYGVIGMQFCNPTKTFYTNDSVLFSNNENYAIETAKKLNKETSDAVAVYGVNKNRLYEVFTIGMKRYLSYETRFSEKEMEELTK